MRISHIVDLIFRLPDLCTRDSHLNAVLTYALLFQAQAIKGIQSDERLCAESCLLNKPYNIFCAEHLSTL